MPFVPLLENRTHSLLMNSCCVTHSTPDFHYSKCTGHLCSFVLPKFGQLRGTEVLWLQQEPRPYWKIVLPSRRLDKYKEEGIGHINDIHPVKMLFQSLKVSPIALARAKLRCPTS